MEIGELEQIHGVPGRCSFVERGELAALVMTSEAAECEIALQGAHVTRFVRPGEPPLLFLSRESHFKRGKAIRGGIPLIFPWFGNYEPDPSKPAHGFARTMLWELDSVDTSRPDRASCVFRLVPNEETRALWPYDFTCIYRVTAGTHLELALEVRNESGAPFSFEEALHTYLQVGDISRVTISGLENTTFIDKTDGMKRKSTGEDLLRIDRFTDSVFLGTSATCDVRDSSLEREITIGTNGSASTILWNPWSDKAAELSDFGDDEWMHMVCVESANVSENGVTLEPGANHTLSARISLQPWR